VPPYVLITVVEDLPTTPFTYPEVAVNISLKEWDLVGL